MEKILLRLVIILFVLQAVCFLIILMINDVGMF